MITFFRLCRGKPGRLSQVSGSYMACTLIAWSVTGTPEGTSLHEYLFSDVTDQVRVLISLFRPFGRLVPGQVTGMFEGTSLQFAASFPVF
jgi:hypothetical protein